MKFIRILTLFAAAILLFASLFSLDAKRELAQSRAAYRHGDMDQALRHARRARWASGKSPATRFHALLIEASAAEKMGNTKKARRYTEALSRLPLPPGCPSCALKRGALRYALGDSKGAIADFNRGLQGASPTASTARVYTLRGLCHLALGEPQKALRDADTALRLTDTSPLAHFLKSKALDHSGNLEAAYREVEIAYALGTKRLGFFTFGNNKWLHYYVDLTHRYHARQN